jgi:hypothetical protein
VQCSAGYRNNSAMTLDIAIDYVPSVDSGNKDTTRRNAVLSAIEEQLRLMDTEILHPAIKATTPSTDTTLDTLLPCTEQGIKPHMPNGDLADRYTKNINLELLASYSQLRFMRDTILEIPITNKIPNKDTSLRNLVTLEAEELKDYERSLDEQINDKKRHLEYVKNARKKQSNNFKPINDFLNHRWSEKVNELAQLQVSKLQQ